MLEAPRRFLRRVRNVKKRLRVGVVDAADLHRFKENALGLREDHLARLRAVDARDHLGRDVARLTAGNRAVRGIRKGEVRLDARDVAGDARNLRVDEVFDLDVLERKDAERDVAHGVFRARAAGKSQGRGKKRSRQKKFAFHAGKIRFAME